MKKMMYSDETIKEEAELIINGSSLREASRRLKIPPSTIWWHIRNVLPEISPDSYSKVDEVLKSHKN